MKKLFFVIFVLSTMAMCYSCQKEVHFGDNDIFNRKMVIFNNTDFDCKLTIGEDSWNIASHNSVDYPYDNYFYDWRIERPKWNDARLEFADGKGTALDYHYNVEDSCYTPAIHNLLDPSYYTLETEDRMYCIYYSISEHDYLAALDPSLYTK